MDIDVDINKAIQSELHRFLRLSPLCISTMKTSTAYIKPSKIDVPKGYKKLNPWLY
jgi:hypothetical protein